MPTLMIIFLCFTASLLSMATVLKNPKASKSLKRLATISFACVTLAFIAMIIAAIFKII